MITTDIFVRSYELDSFGHVNNAVYLQYFELARTQWLATAGLAFSDIKTYGILIVIRNAEISYTSPAYMGDTLRCTCSVAQWTGATITFDYKITALEREVSIASGRTLGACICATKLRPIRWSNTIRTLFDDAAKKAN